MTGQLEQTIKERLMRLSKSTEDVSRIQACALSGEGCATCAGHKGVELLIDTPTVTARVCDCVKKCNLCSGSCLKPHVTSHDETSGGKKLRQQDRIGEVTSCVTPSPRKLVGIFNEARIPSRYLEADLSKFDGFSPSERSQKTTIANWIKTLKPGQSSGLLLSGPVGIGKSWLLAAMAKHLALKGFSVRYADFFQLVHELREAYSTEQADRSSLRPFQSVDVLIIDELGKGRNTEWELSVADSLISDRYNGNKCIIAATNYPLRGNAADHQQRQIDYLRTESSTNQMNTVSFEPLAQRIGSRMFSRLVENCICMEVSGSDRRRR
jgi:DNA replication protein DnaC